MFSVDGTALHQTTVGVGLNPTGGGNLYVRPDSVALAQPYSLTLRARVTAYEELTGANKFGFFFDAADGARRFAIAISPTIIQDLNFVTLSSSIDNTVFHTYRLDVPIVGSASLYVDNVFVANTSVQLAGYSRLAFGDGTGGSNANVDITQYSFNQVPEPAALGTIAVAAIAGLGRRRRTRSI